MEKQTVFIKRYPSKGELPNENEAYFITNLGRLKFDIYESVFRCPLLEDSYPEIEYWLEEIELPSEEWFIKEVDRLTNHSLNKEWRDTVSMGYLACANFILNHLKSNTNG